MVYESILDIRKDVIMLCSVDGNNVQYIGEVMAMMITNIGSASQIRGIYVYGNSHYNETRNTAVLPVNRVSFVPRLEDKEDEVKVAVTYQSHEENKINEEAAVLKEQENLAESYKNQEVARYDLTNPYELAKMSIENSLLSGMHFDMLA